MEQLLPLVETALRRLARGYLRRERQGHTLQPTALVNEAFMRILDAKNLRWNDRSHFMSIAARLMRRVLVDHARARTSQKRAFDAADVAWDEAVVRRRFRSGCGRSPICHPARALEIFSRD